MSYTYRTSANNSANANTITISPTAGDVVVLISMTSSGGGTPTMTVADGQSGVWTTTSINGTANGAGYYASIAYCLNAPAGVTTLTATFNGGTPGNCDMAATSYGGLSSPSFVGINHNYQNSPGTGTNAIVSAALNVGAIPALFIGIVTDGTGNGGTTAGTGFTRRVNNVTSLDITTEDPGAEVTGSQIATFTNTTHGTDMFDTYAIAFVDYPVNTYGLVSGGAVTANSASDAVIALYDTFAANDLITLSYALFNAGSAYVPVITDTLNSGSYSNCFDYYYSSGIESWGTSYIAVQSAASPPFVGLCTLVISTNVMTVTGVTSGTLLAGAAVTGTGISAANGPSIVAAYGTGGTTGTGGTGTYQLSKNATATESTPVTVTAASCVITVAYSAGNWSQGNALALHWNGWTGVPTFDSSGFSSGSGTTNAISAGAATTYNNEYYMGFAYCVGGGGSLPHGTPTGSAWSDTYQQSGHVCVVFAHSQAVAGSLSYITTQASGNTYPWYVGISSFYNGTGSLAPAAGALAIAGVAGSIGYGLTPAVA
jgi:hypothetical protein